jgi:hypothetical protein
MVSVSSITSVIHITEKHPNMYECSIPSFNMYPMSSDCYTKFYFVYSNLPRFIIPTKNMAQTIVSSYQVQLKHSMKGMITAITSKQSKFERIMHNFATYIISDVCFIVFPYISFYHQIYHI